MSNLNSVRFECTRLGNKMGHIKQDQDGYWTMPVGGLDVFNTSGQKYVYEEAKHLFEESSVFMRRVKKGTLRAENGHPVKTPGMSEKDYVRRVLTIDERNVCAYHKAIWLDFESIKDKNGKPVIAIMSKLCPSGPHADMVERRLKQPGENVCWSIRSFTRDYMDRGVYKRALETIVTFDLVNEPGIEFAEKFSTPSMEADTSFEQQFTRGQMERALVEDTTRNGSGFGLAQESARLTAGELFKSLGWEPQPAGPAYSKW